MYIDRSQNASKETRNQNKKRHAMKSQRTEKSGIGIESILVQIRMAWYAYAFSPLASLLAKEKRIKEDQRLGIRETESNVSRLPSLSLRHSLREAEQAQEFLSRNSFASLIFVARYGLPPRSGWLRSISWRCLTRTFSFVRLRSLFE